MVPRYLALELRSPLPVVAITLAYVVTDEFHQTFVEGRHGTPVDVLIDAAGWYRPADAHAADGHVHGNSRPAGDVLLPYAHLDQHRPEPDTSAP